MTWAMNHHRSKGGTTWNAGVLTPLVSSGSGLMVKTWCTAKRTPDSRKGPKVTQPDSFGGMTDLPDNWHRVIALARRQHYPDVADRMKRLLYRTPIGVNNLYDDGTVDDIFGEGFWHLEMMDNGSAYFGVGEDGEYQFTIHADGDDLVIEPYDATNLDD